MLDANHFFEPGADKVELVLDLNQILPDSTSSPIREKVLSALPEIHCPHKYYKKIHEVISANAFPESTLHDFCFLAIAPHIIKSKMQEANDHVDGAMEQEEMLNLKTICKANGLPRGVLKYQSNDGEINLTFKNKRAIDSLFSGYIIPEDNSLGAIMIHSARLMREAYRDELGKDLKLPSLRDLIAPFLMSDTSVRRFCAHMIRDYCFRFDLIQNLESEWDSNKHIAKLIRDLFVATDFLNQENQETRLTTLIRMDLKEDRMLNIFS